MSAVARLSLSYVAGSPARRVTWLELFYDLVFVAAVAQVGQPLSADYTPESLVRYTVLFVLIWWAWMGNTVFATRFGSDDVVQRSLTVVQIFAVAAMAANATDALDSRSSAGFAAAYGVLRLFLVAQYARARRIERARSLATRYFTGHGIAAVLWIVSALAPAPDRFLIWTLAFVIDLGTPWIAVKHSAEVPPDAAHLPERFGLFTLILLGESVVAIMQGMESQEYWSVTAASAAFLGMVLIFAIWWLYFEVVSGAAEQHVRTHRDAVRFHIWSYAHLPLYIGIAAAGVGVERIVEHQGSAAPHAADAPLLIGALVAIAAAMTVIGVFKSAE
jgi:low temperature requirement protein LtrA